ncbi:MAG TPA: hypothetical protein VHW03_09945 [Chthoniobacterales bacterium]|jgi:hypothetical protein|nr:hypothetical protein [Chthoniobacterales bacterium]
MTNEIENAIAQMLEKHGGKKVRAQLSQLIGRSKWSDWQRVANLVDRLEKRGKLRRKRKKLF